MDPSYLFIYFFFFVNWTIHSANTIKCLKAVLNYNKIDMGNSQHKKQGNHLAVDNRLKLVLDVESGNESENEEILERKRVDKIGVLVTDGILQQRILETLHSTSTKEAIVVEIPPEQSLVKSFRCISTLVLPIVGFMPETRTADFERVFTIALSPSSTIEHIVLLSALGAKPENPIGQQFLTIENILLKHDCVIRGEVTATILRLGFPMDALLAYRSALSSGNFVMLKQVRMGLISLVGMCSASNRPFYVHFVLMVHC